MKKALLFLLAVFCALSLFSCDIVTSETTTDDSETTITTSETTTDDSEDYKIDYEPKVKFPLAMSFERFEEIILKPLYDQYGDDLFSDTPFIILKNLSYYAVYSKGDIPTTLVETDKLNKIVGKCFDNLSDKEISQLKGEFPVVDKMAICIFDPNASDVEIERFNEWFIETFPDYSIDDLSYDYHLMGCTAEPAVSSETLSQSQFLYKFDIVTGTYSVINIQSLESSEVIIPSTFNGMPVSGISNLDLTNTPSSIITTTKITTIRIPVCINEISQYALQGHQYLESVIFEGTVEQWNAIEKGDRWDEYPRAYTIYCTDGEIPKTE